MSVRIAALGEEFVEITKTHIQAELVDCEYQKVIKKLFDLIAQEMHQFFCHSRCSSLHVIFLLLQVFPLTSFQAIALLHAFFTFLPLVNFSPDLFSLSALDDFLESLIREPYVHKWMKLAFNRAKHSLFQSDFANYSIPCCKRVIITSMITAISMESNPSKKN